MRELGAYLQVKKLTKKFGAFIAIQDVSLDVLESEFVCFLGPSGCGKTTLLRAIAGLETVTEGTIHQAGREITRLSPLNRDFGIVFQSYALFPNLTVFDNVAYGLRSQRLSRARISDRVSELLRLIHLEDAGTKFPAQLSGGQQQRVAVARALAISPGLLLLDEPLSALDARVRLSLRKELRKLQQELKLTTIMVTHDQEEALTLADRIVVMNGGRIEQVGTPTEIYHRPKTLFVANFVGAMNFLAAEHLGGRRLRVGHIELECEQAINASKPGDKVTACIRPEDVIVRGVNGQTPNAFDAEVAEVEFMGPFSRVVLRPRGWNMQTLTVDMSNNAQRDLGVERGGLLRIACPPPFIHIYRAGLAE